MHVACCLPHVFGCKRRVPRVVGGRLQRDSSCAAQWLRATRCAADRPIGYVSQASAKSGASTPAYDAVEKLESGEGLAWHELLPPFPYAPIATDCGPIPPRAEKRSPPRGPIAMHAPPAPPLSSCEAAA